jgi:hypothetical protein
MKEQLRKFLDRKVCVFVSWRVGGGGGGREGQGKGWGGQCACAFFCSPELCLSVLFSFSARGVRRDRDAKLIR